VPNVRLSSQAEKAIEKLARADRKLFERVDRALSRIGEDPGLGKPLQGPLSGLRSFRVGPVRIVYRFEADRLLVFVLDIDQRGRIYRDRD
jgi:mRNA interferase RelE/StbE